MMATQRLITEPGHAVDTLPISQAELDRILWRECDDVPDSIHKENPALQTAL